MNFKRSLSYNDLSIFNPEVTMKRTQSHKNIRFAGIKNICLFKSSDSPSRIASSRRYSQSFPEWTIQCNFKEFIGLFGSNVALESLKIIHNQVIGKILVRNISYTKDVVLWYSMDDWKTVLHLKCDFENIVSVYSLCMSCIRP